MKKTTNVPKLRAYYVNQYKALKKIVTREEKFTENIMRARHFSREKRACSSTGSAQTSEAGGFETECCDIR